jgi:predicted DNA-binding protein (MmcQ/YjbR family)
VTARGASKTTRATRATRAPRGTRAARAPRRASTGAALPEDARLREITRLCQRLPEAERSLHGDHASYRVRGKVFAYFLNNHHGDGIVSVCCKSAMAEHVDRVSRDPRRYYLPAYIGARGWFGLRLDAGRIDWREVQNVIELSYCLVAAKTLVRLWEAAARS